MISTTTALCELENGNLGSFGGAKLMYASDPLSSGTFEISDSSSNGLAEMYRVMIEDSFLNCTFVTTTPDNTSFGLAVLIVLISIMFVGFLWNNLFKGKKGYDTTTL